MVNPVFGESLGTRFTSTEASVPPVHGAMAGIALNPDALTLAHHNFDQVLWKDLHSDPQLVASHFPVDAPPIFRMLDSEFRTQVFADAIRQAKESFGQELSSGEKTVSICLGLAREKAFAHAHEFRHSLHDLWVACQDKSLMALFGTANHHVWNEDLESFLNILARKSAEVGVSNINGGATCGLMGRATEAWKAAIKNWNGENPENPTDATVILVLLAIYSKESPEPPAEALVARLRSHPLATFMTRTRAMSALSAVACSLFFPGGLGTSQELGVAVADEQVGDRVIRDTIASSRHLALINSRFEVRDPGTGEMQFRKFWNGLQRLHERMDNLGELKNPVRASIACYDIRSDVPEDDSLADLLVKCCAGSRSVHDQPMDPHEKYIREKVQYALDSHRTFNMASFAPDALPYHHFLDAQYSGQVRLEAETLAMEIVLNAEAHNFEDFVIDAAVRDAVEQAVKWRGQLRRLIDELHECKTIVISGTAKDSVIEKDATLVQYASTLVEKAIRENITLVIQGDGKEGVARLIGEVWAQRKTQAPESKSQLVRLQLKMRDEMAPGRRWDAEGTPISDERAKYLETLKQRVIRERLGPPIASTLVRSHSALALGNVQEIVVFPGDSVNFSFIAEALLARQLSEVTATPFTNKNVPEMTFVDAKFGEAEGFFDGWREQLETFLLCGTAKPKHLAGVRFVTP